MSESIIADFVGKFNAEMLTRAEPVKGRVLLSPKRLVLVAREDDKLTIPLSSVFDIAVGHVPPGLGDFFDSTVTIAFQRGDSRHVAAIEADDEKISKFSTVLFKAILNGTETTVKERARVGGRVTSEEFATAKLFLKPDVVEFRKPDGSFEVALKTVTDFQRSGREIAGSIRPTLTVRHVMDGTAITTEAALASPRKLSILGRFLRLEYSDLRQELEDVELTADKREILVAMYSTCDLEERRLANIVGVEDAEVTMLLQELTTDGLLQDSADGSTLTPTGKVAVSRYFKDVDD